MSLDKALNELHFTSIAHITQSHASNDTHVKEAKKAILTDLLEIINEDENSQVEEQHASPQPTIDEHYRNQLRQELRDKVRKYCE